MSGEKPAPRARKCSFQCPVTAGPPCCACYLRGAHSASHAALPPSALPGASPKPFPTPNRGVWGLLPSLESPAPYAMVGVEVVAAAAPLSFAMEEGGAPARRLTPLLLDPS